ncbi:hypothetical protein YC2023_085431 [Brassica napus]
MKAVASQRQSRTVIGGIDQPSETRTGRKYRNRCDKKVRGIERNSLTRGGESIFLNG